MPIAGIGKGGMAPKAGRGMSSRFLRMEESQLLSSTESCRTSSARRCTFSFPILLASSGLLVLLLLLLLLLLCSRFADVVAPELLRHLLLCGCKDEEDQRF